MFKSLRPPNNEGRMMNDDKKNQTTTGHLSDSCEQKL